MEYYRQIHHMPRIILSLTVHKQSFQGNIHFKTTPDFKIERYIRWDD